MNNWMKEPMLDFRDLIPSGVKLMNSLFPLVIIIDNNLIYHGINKMTKILELE